MFTSKHAMKPSAAFESNRECIRRIVLAHRASNPRVFGSVLHGSDSKHSDLDLLVDPAPNASLLDIAHIQVELEAVLGVPVDVLTPAALPIRFRAQVLHEARAI
jgi:predicted nucleotidyltransferase